MNCSIIIATYGDQFWEELAKRRALPTAKAQEPHEILIGHDQDASIASVRNELASKATGDWLCFLDADDELGEGYLVAMQRAFLRESKHNRSLLLTPSISYVRKSIRMPPKFHPVGNFQNDNYIVIGTLLPKSLFEEVGGFNDYPHGFEDWSLWAKCWKAGAEVIQVRRAIYYAFVNQNSKHRLGWKNHKWQIETHMKIRKELFPELA